MAGGVVDGESVSAAVTNAAFLHKNADETMPYVLSMTAAASGGSITNPQQAINTLLTATGSTEGTPGTTPIAHGGTGQTTASAAFNALAPTTTKGDLIAYDTGTNARVAVGTDGQVLKADSTASTGVSWTTNISGSAGNVTGTVAIANGGTGQTTKAPAFDALSPLTTGGDLLYGGASGTGTRLANGTSGQVLQSNGGTSAPSWTTNISGNAANVTGTVAIGNGGTGQTTKAAGFDALSPMTTSGDIIYGGTSGTGTRLAKGTDGQVLTLASGIPSWAAAQSGNFGAGLYYAIVDNGSTTNYYSTTSSSAADFTVNGTPAFTQKYKSGFVTIGGAASNAPGITLTAPVTGTLRILCHTNGLLTADNSNIYLTDGSNTILDASSHHENAANAPFGTTLTAFYDVTATTSYTFKIRGATASGTLKIGSDTQSTHILTFSIEYVK